MFLTIEEDDYLIIHSVNTDLVQNVPDIGSSDGRANRLDLQN